MISIDEDFLTKILNTHAYCVMTKQCRCRSCSGRGWGLDDWVKHVVELIRIAGS